MTKGRRAATFYQTAEVGFIWFPRGGTAIVAS